MVATALWLTRRVLMAPSSYREIRSARYPLGLPDRSDLTVMEAFADGWLLIQHSPGGADLVGIAEDYSAARAWLVEETQDPPGTGP